MGAGDAAGAKDKGIAGFVLPSCIDASVIEAVQRLAADDPERPAKAFKLFLAHTLKAQLAQHALSPAALQSLADTTWERMSEDPQLREDIARAQEALLGLSRPRAA